MKLILRMLGVILLLFAMVALVVDGTKTLSANGSLVITSFGQQWLEFNPSSMFTAKKAVEEQVSPILWDPIIATLLLWPTWIIFGGLGIGLSKAGFSPAAVIERDRFCCDTIRENHERGFWPLSDWPLWEGDIRDFDYGRIDRSVDLVRAGARPGVEHQENVAVDGGRYNSLAATREGARQESELVGSGHIVATFYCGRADMARYETPSVSA